MGKLPAEMKRHHAKQSRKRKQKIKEAIAAAKKNRK